MKRENAGLLVLAGLFAVFGYVTRCAPGHLDGNATPAPVETRTPERIAELERIAKTEAARSRVPEAAPSQDAPGTVRAADFGPDWPFVPQEGILACLPNAGRPVVLLTVDSGKRYALNGNARELVDGYAIRDLKEILRPGRSPRGAIAAGLALCRQ